MPEASTSSTERGHLRGSILGVDVGSMTMIVEVQKPRATPFARNLLIKRSRELP